MIKTLSSIITAFAALFVSNLTYAQTANVQIIHNCADPAAAIVDVYINGSLTLNDFEFRSATPFLSVPAGTTLNIGIAPENSTSVDDTLVNFPVTFANGSNYYVVASGVLNPANFAANPNNLSIGFGLRVYDQAITSGNSPDACSIQFFHGSTDAPAVDVLERNLGVGLYTNSTFGNFGGGYVEAPTANPLILDVTPYQQNENVLITYLASISALNGQSALAFASGFLNPAANQNGAAFGVFVALANGVVVALPDTQIAALNIIHNSPDPAASTVDIYVNNNLFLNDFAFRTATGFVQVPAGEDINVGIAPGNSTSASDIIATFTYNLTNNKNYLIIAEGVLNPANFSSNPDGISTAFDLNVVNDALTNSGSANNVKFNVFHGSPDAPTVDIKLAGGSILVDDISFNSVTSYLAVPAATYFLEVTPGNDNNTVVAAYTANLSALGGQAITVFASGFLNPAANQNGEPFGLFACLPNGTVVELPLTVAANDTAQIQIIHNAADPAAASVDIYLNGSLLLDNFAFRAATPFVTVPADVTLTVSVAPPNSTSVNDAIASFDIILAPNSKNIAIANGVLMPMSFATNPDGENTAFTIWLDTNGQTAAVNPTKVDVKVVHGSTDAPTVDVLVQGVSTPIVDNAKYSDITPYITVDPITYTLVITPGNNNNVVVKKYSAPLSTAQGGAAVVFASGFLNPAANQSGPAFGLYAALPNGFVLALPDVTEVSAGSIALGSVSTYPNPASEVIIVNNQGAKDINAQLFDLNGKLILDLGVINANTYRSYSTELISNGMYQMVLNDGINTQTVKTVIVK